MRDEYSIPMTQKMDEEVSLMCNLSDGVWEQGMQRGIQQGIQQGVQQGVQQGNRQTKLDDLQNLMAATGWDLNRSMDVLKIPEADRSGYVEAVRTQSFQM